MVRSFSHGVRHSRVLVRIIDFFSDRKAGLVAGVSGNNCDMSGSGSVCAGG